MSDDPEDAPLGALGDLLPKVVEETPSAPVEGALSFAVEGALGALGGPGQNLSDVVAAPGVRPEDWQAPTPASAYRGRGDAVGESEDLDRILALPRREPLDVRSPAAEALVERITLKYSLPARAENEKRARAAEFAGDRDGASAIRAELPCSCRQLDHKQACITRLLPLQAWALDEIEQVGGLVGQLAVGSGKCLDAATEIYDASTGRRRRADEVGSLRVTSFDGEVLHSSAAEAFESGVKKCVETVLADGSAITTSSDHPILTPNGYVHAGKLEIGDLVGVPTHVPSIDAVTRASDDEVKFVAYMLADGSCSSNQMTFTNMTPPVIVDFKSAAFALGYGVSISGKKSKATTYNVLVRREAVSLNYAIRDRWNLRGLSKNKRTHADVWGLPDRQVALFLNRFWACDGHVSKRGLEISLASEALIDDLKFLLLRLGIRARKRFTPKHYTKNGERSRKFDAWSLNVYAGEALRFLERVGDVLGKVRACKTLRASLERLKHNSNFDIVPVGYEEVAEIYDELELPKWSARGAIKRFLHPTRGQYISRAKFIEFCARWNYRGKYTHLACADVAWERVTAKTARGVRKVYDVSVPGDHNLVANNIVVHNTVLNILGSLALSGCRCAIVLVPSNLIEQMEDDYRRASGHFRVPSAVFYRTTKPKRYVSQSDPGTVIHVIAHTKLSRPESSDLLDTIPADAIIVDECDALASILSSRGRRLIRAFKARPSTRLLAWTGSLTDAHLMDYWALMILALRHGAPVPLKREVAEEWGTALDAGEYMSPPGALLRLCAPGEEVRVGYQRRLRDTLGFVSSTESRVVVEATGEAVELVIRERPAPKLPAIIEEALRKVRNDNLRPDTLAPEGPVYDDDPLDDPLKKAKCAAEVASGMFYRFVFPRGEPRPLIMEWFAKRKKYFAEVRETLLLDRPFLDSPGLLEAAAKRYHGHAPPALLEDGTPDPTRPKWASTEWCAWHAIRDKVEPKTQAVRLHDYLVQDAAQWARESPGIVWYSMVEYGQWLAEVSGFPLHSGGPDAGRRILREDGSRTIIASINSHGRGRNGLQHRFSRQLIAQIASSNRRWTQLLGRLDRRGQAHTEVSTELYAHTAELRKALRQALSRANYVFQTMGEDQKLLTGWQGFDGYDLDDDLGESDE